MPRGWNTGTKFVGEAFPDWLGVAAKGFEKRRGQPLEGIFREMDEVGVAEILDGFAGAAGDLLKAFS
jgi:hypothetical protein